VLLLALVAWGWGCMFGCQAEKAWQFNAPMSGEVDADLYATIDVDTTTVLSGEASATTILGFITIDGPTRFAEGVMYSANGSDLGFLSMLFGGGMEKLKSAAAYEAVYGKHDVIVAPRWEIETTDYVIFSKSKARVMGYPGTIRKIDHNPYRNWVHPVDLTSREAAGPRQVGVLTGTASTVPPAPSTFASPSALPQAYPRATSNGSTLLVQDIEVGSGPISRSGDIVVYHYTCTLDDGRVVFDSRSRGGPRERVAGAATSPVGLRNALLGVRSGGHRRVTLPPDQAYGQKGLDALSIPPNATVTFDLFIDDVATDGRS
jgi:hypothetical protein